MAYVRDLIAGSLRLIGALDPSEAVDGQAAQDALQVLNELIESLNLEHLLNPTGVNRVDVTLVGGQQIYTIGTGGNFNTARPVAIDKAFVVISGVEYPVDVVNHDEWAAIPTKDLLGIPEKLYYEPEYPLGKVYLYPKPESGYSMAIWGWDRLAAFGSVNDAISLPPGYARMLRYNLAVELGIEWGKALKPEVAQIAIDSKAAIKRVNDVTPILTPDEAFRGGSSCGGGIAPFLAGD